MIFTWTKADATNATDESGRWAVCSGQKAEKVWSLASKTAMRTPNFKRQTALVTIHEPRITTPIPSAFIRGFNGFPTIS
jgi:hypothetical protein